MNTRPLRLFLSLATLTALASLANAQSSNQPEHIPHSHRLQLLSGEAYLTAPSHQHPSMIKPEGELFETINIIEQQITLSASTVLPQSGEIRVDFIAQIDGVDRVDFYMFGADPSEQSFEFSRDGEVWNAASVRTFVNGAFSVIFSDTLNVGDQGSIRYRIASMDFSEEGPPSAVVDRPLTHLITSRYLLFNAETALFDSFSLTTVIRSDGSTYPAGLGQIISRPETGVAGDWVYQSEIDSYITVYAIGAGPPWAAGSIL